MAGKVFFSKSKMAVLSSLFSNLSATGFAIVLISPGLGAISNTADLFRLLTMNLPWGIVFLLIAMKFEEKAR